jgi:outer membrane protein assembly factor BamB
MGVYKMFDSSNGQLLWDGRSFEPITGNPAMGSLVYVPSQDQTLYALDRNNGTDRWKFRDTKPIRTDPILIGRHVFLPLERGGIVVLGATNGKQAWRLEENALPVTVAGPHVIMYTATSICWMDLENGRILKELPTKPLRKVFPGPDNSLVVIGADGYMQRIDPMR